MFRQDNRIRAGLGAVTRSQCTMSPHIDTACFHCRSPGDGAREDLAAGGAWIRQYSPSGADWAICNGRTLATPSQGQPSPVS